MLGLDVKETPEFAGIFPADEPILPRSYLVPPHLAKLADNRVEHPQV